MQREFLNLEFARKLVDENGREETLALLDRLLALPPGTKDVPSQEDLKAIKSAVERVAPSPDVESKSEDVLPEASE